MIFMAFISFVHMRYRFVQVLLLFIPLEPLPCFSVLNPEFLEDVDLRLLQLPRQRDTSVRVDDALLSLRELEGDFHQRAFVLLLELLLEFVGLDGVGVEFRTRERPRLAE